jgi:hypothetical protein
MKRKPRDIILTVVTSTAVLAALLWWLPHPEQMLDAAASVPAPGWAGTAVGMALSYRLRAIRLCDEWASRLGLRLRDALHLVLIHSAAISVLPLRAGEAGYPWLLYRRHGVSLGASASSLLWLRVQDSSVGLLLAWVCVGPGPGLPVRVVLALATVLALALCGRPFALRALRRLPPAGASEALPSDGPDPPSKRLMHRLQAACRVLCQAVAHAPSRVWLWSVLNWLVKMISGALLIAALLGLWGPQGPAAWAPLWPVYGGAVLGEIGSSLPLQPPAGFGAYECGVLLGTRLLGLDATASAVLGAALVAHLFLVALGLVYALASSWMDAWSGGPDGRRHVVADEEVHARGAVP